jgi:hypothetical protein
MASSLFGMMYISPVVIIVPLVFLVIALLGFIVLLSRLIQWAVAPRENKRLDQLPTGTSATAPERAR